MTIYTKGLEKYFLECKLGLETSFEAIMSYDWLLSLDYLELVYYPESFTSGFAMYIWPISKDGTMLESTMEIFFLIIGVPQGFRAACLLN